MIKRRKLKKGATLIELTVVLAVLAIVSTMIVSFSVFLSARVDTSVKANSLMQDVVSIKATFEGWVDELTEEQATFSCENSSLKATVNSSEYSIALTDNVLSATMPSGEDLTINITVIKELAFNVVENDSKTQTLFICKAFYWADNKLQYFSFTVNPFVNDVVQGGV